MTVWILGALDLSLSRNREFASKVSETKVFTRLRGLRLDPGDLFLTGNVLGLEIRRMPVQDMQICRVHIDMRE